MRQTSTPTVTVGLFVRIEAKPGMEARVEERLRSVLPEIEQETATTVWLAIRLGPSTFAVVDAFDDESGRQVHLEAGRARLMDGASELFAQPPSIEYTDIIAAKIPQPEPLA
jgi:quinol monooxygenase YgiN